MVFRFTILSDEVDNFLRVIDIDAEATFFDLHNAILDAVNFKKDQITSFFLCSDDWEKEQEITLIEMDSSSEYDNLVMDKVKLEELLTDEKQKLMYVFDMISDRAFFIELSEIIPRKKLEKPVCIKSIGNPPEQTLSENDVNQAPKLNVEENFYGDEDFELDELDEEGFSDFNFDDDSNLFNDDTNF
ncbi:MAG TPA: hypothetical protein PKV22_00365 [Paludibacteraceae bacterium]|mgnify:FL=1|nr:hypothetical protein [Paludibacteraceae bacterium]